VRDVADPKRAQSESHSVVAHPLMAVEALRQPEYIPINR
jgi:hypothetical protein